MSGVSRVSTSIELALGWQRVKGWAAVFILLSSIIGFGMVVEALVDDRSWAPIADAPQIPGLKKIENLPPPFELHFPGAAQAWVYGLEESEGVYVVVIYYQRESQGSELVSSENGFLDRELWRQVSSASVLVGGEHQFRKVIHQAESQPAVNIFSQYRFVSSLEVIRPSKAKIVALRDLLFGANGSTQVSILISGGELDAVTELSPVLMRALFLEIEDELVRIRE